MIRAILLPCVAAALIVVTLVGCNKDNGTGTHDENGKEIAEKGSFQGQETHGQVGIVEDQQNAAEPTPGFSNAADQ
jgi:hypothetical protein